jgi:hypothetical protein
VQSAYDAAAMPRTAALAVACLVSACSVDGLVLTPLARKGHRTAPDPAPQTLTGQAWAGAAVAVAGADGAAIAGLQGNSDAQGRFSLTLDGAKSLQSALVSARQGRRLALALVPELPAQVHVTDPPRTFDLRDLSPGALELGPTSTALALLAVGRARTAGLSLAAVAPDTLVQTLIDVHGKLAKGDPALTNFAQMVARLHAGADVKAAGDGAYDTAGTGSLLRVAFLLANPVDYTGDAVADLDTAAFDAALAAATAAFQFHACYAPDKIKVVLQTQLHAAPKNGNCEAFDPFQWAKNEAGARMFVTGGVHKEAPICDSGAQPPCLTAKQVDDANAQLGRWVPNQVPMWDDGTHGDGKAGDGVWTASFELPWLDPAKAQGPVRIAYKFTYGTGGQGWTATEEFPGNQRILELVDVNGDGLVVRRDFFADETGNKDKANLLSPANGGCGQVFWPSKAAPDCSHDARERPVDQDGDCKPDGWPAPGAVAPLTVPCKP